jgi:hypothetical protein
VAHQPARPSIKAGTASISPAVSAAAAAVVPRAASIRWRIAVTSAAKGARGEDPMVTDTRTLIDTFVELWKENKLEELDPLA